CGDRTVIHAELEDETVDLVRGHPRFHDRDEFIEALRREAAGPAHALEGLGTVKADLPGVAERSGVRVEIGDHSEIHRDQAIGNDRIGRDLAPYHKSFNPCTSGAGEGRDIGRVELGAEPEARSVPPLHHSEHYGARAGFAYSGKLVE